jgi:hypothetical protein
MGLLITALDSSLRKYFNSNYAMIVYFFCQLVNYEVAL